ncbi:MAG: excinuclease ABC subunit UvrC [Clostridia bacterium]|nr:excinuclease ABC subunit UvrC [Clostridia bacterium]
MNDTLKIKIAKLPTCPGCYLMKSEGKIIYVGKAVNLKNRVSQYFHQSRDHTVKVRAMVSRIDDFDIVLCDTNLEALILECNLIKLHKPQYNILLKDDKHYPYLKINLGVDYPRVEIVRRIEKDKAKYFGPYMGTTGVREVMDVLRGIFPLRTCQGEINPDPARRPCLHYQLGECLAPCAGKTTKEAYGKIVQEVIDFLGGKSETIEKRLQTEMLEASSKLNFERAAELRDRLASVGKLMERQKAINVKGGNRDILAVASDSLDAMVEVLFVRGGLMIGAENYTLEGEGDQTVAHILGEFLLQYYDEGRQVPEEILCLELPEQAEDLQQLLSERRGGNVTIHEPQRGTKHQMIEMAVKNARDALDKRNAGLSRARERTIGACEALQNELKLEKIPRRIEGYDISNTQGVLSVASMVVAINGEAASKEYRRFRIKTVEGANDFASMNEVLTRRLSRATAEREALAEKGELREDGSGLTGFADLPDLIVIDGGPQQLRFARSAMQELGYNIPIIGLAKRLDEVFMPDSEESILLDRKSPALHLLQRVRDESHRFGITYHRSLRQKAGMHSTLEDIQGIGPTRRRALLSYFKSIANIASASIEKLCEVDGIGPSQAQVIYDHYHAHEGVEMSDNENTQDGIS